MLHSTIPLVFLVFQLSGTNGNIYYKTLKEGDDAHFFCKYVLSQNQCDLTNWNIGLSPKYRGLFINGKKQRGVSSSVTLREDCSLVFQKVTVEQANFYTCQQDDDDRKKTEYLLFVASLTQLKKDGRVALNCSLTPLRCQHEVRWLNNGEEVTTDPDLMLKESGVGCWASVSFTDTSPPSHFYHNLKCEVKQFYIDHPVLLSPTPPSGGEEGGEGGEGGESLTVILVPICLLLIVMVTTLIICCWKCSQRGGGGEDTPRPQDDYANIENQERIYEELRLEEMESPYGELGQVLTSAQVPGARSRMASPENVVVEEEIEE